MKLFYSIATALLLFAVAHSQSPVIVGTTTYDYQMYGSSSNRLIGYTDGKVTASWMGSNTFGTGFSNLGTYYNHFNGTSWGSFPTARLESQKTYSTGIVTVQDAFGDHEVVLADDVSKIRVYENTTIGGTSWTQTGGTNILDVWYPESYCPPGTNDIYVVGQKPNTEDLLFSRSDDGGESWVVNELALPFTTEAYGCDIVLSGSYQIVAQGSDVYVLYGSLISDLILMHSASNGASGTWELEATLLDFPIDNYTAGAGETTDFDGDGDYDWLDTNDGILEMIITDDGTVHCFAGRMQIRDVAGVTGFYYDYSKGGIYHWKSGDGAATLHEEFFVDWDGDGDPMSGISENLNAYYYESATWMPTATYDESIGRLYLVYMMPVENEISASNQNYFDLFGTYTDDNGATWTDPVNLTYTAFMGQENAYPSSFQKAIDNKVQVLWQQDYEPGTYVDPAPDDDEVVTNNMLFVAWDSTRFQPYVPSVAFTYVATAVGADYSVVFTNLSTDAETYLWEFGDGATSVVISPTHLYEAGLYEACLTGYNNYGSATVCQTLSLLNEPIAEFSYSGDPTVTFIDESTGGIPDTWTWAFGDGGTSTLQDPVHTYALNGTYEVCLTAANAMGESTHCEFVEIDAYPVAAFTYTDTDPLFLFFDASTGDPTGFTWDWTFGDGATSTLEDPTHTYAENGTYEVCLTASNIYGTSTSCEEMTVDSYLAPEVSFSYTGDPTVIFTDLSTGAPFEWDWDFGDGAVSDIQNPTHTFASNGSYTVCLTATNDIGSAGHCETVIIDGYEAPEALFTYSGDPVVTFEDLSSNDPTSWIWDFGDGGFSTTQDPVHTFEENGTFLVCLTAIGPGGSDTYCDNLDIEFAELAPVADFEWAVAGALTITFTDLSSNVPTEWNWSFGDGSISSLQHPIHTYANAGTYNVCLTAGNAAGSTENCKSVLVTGMESVTVSLSNIYPNPAGETLVIETSVQLSDFRLRIVNGVGQLIQPASVESLSTGGIKLDLSGLPAGCYFISITTGLNSYTGSFIKD